MSTAQQLTRDELPASILAYLDKSGTAEASEAFSPSATVSDVGTRYSTPEEIRTFATKVATEYDYTTTFQGASKRADGKWVVLNRLEGNFPGGVADLQYTFTLDGSLISQLDISA